VFSHFPLLIGSFSSLQLQYTSGPGLGSEPLLFSNNFIPYRFHLT
jgi:hypothetical protein